MTAMGTFTPYDEELRRRHARDETPSELPPRLRCMGGDIVKPNGKPIFLRGPCFGSWDEDDETDCPQIDGMGANSLRINLRWWGKYGTGTRENADCRDNDAFAFLHRAKYSKWAGQIKASSAVGLWSIPFIDSNCGQSGTNTPEDIAYCDPYGTWGERGHNFYTDASMRKVFATVVWAAAAARLRTLANVGMLEIHPEPAHQRDETWSPLVAQVQKECIDAIRAAEAALGDPVGTPILVGARDAYSNEHMEEGLLALLDAYGGTLPGNLIFTGNLLNQWVANPPRFDKAIDRFNRLRDTYGVPVYCQQIGRNSSEDPDLRLMRRAVRAMRENDIGYAWWQWKQNTSNPGNFALHFKDPNDPSGLTWTAKQNELDLLSEEWQS
jgi:hypothetical protein